MLKFIKKLFGINDEAVPTVEVEPVNPAKPVKRIKKPAVVKEEVKEVEVKEVEVKKVPKRTKKELLNKGATVVSFVPKKRGRPKKAK